MSHLVLFFKVDYLKKITLRKGEDIFVYTIEKILKSLLVYGLTSKLVFKI